MNEVSTISVRPIEKSDYKLWHGLWEAYLAFYEATVTEDVYQTTFRRLTSNEPNEFSGMLAFNEKNEAVGLVHYLFHRHAWKVENVCYPQDLFTSEKARGAGVGRTLIEAVYEEADKAGSPSVYWLTQDFNHTARQLYDRIGKLTPFIRYQRG